MNFHCVDFLNTGTINKQKKVRNVGAASNRGAIASPASDKIKKDGRQKKTLEFSAPPPPPPNLVPLLKYTTNKITIPHLHITFEQTFK